MNKTKIVMMIFSIALLFITGIYLMLPSKKQAEITKINEKETEQSLTEETIKSAERIDSVLMSFAKTIYEYNTRERKFYEGADAYMTEDAYHDFVPLPEDDGETPEEIVVVESMLMGAQFYHRYIDSVYTEVLMEASFSLSKSGNGFITQYMKLWVTQEGGEYKIAKCQIIDTLEQ